MTDVSVISPLFLSFLSIPVPPFHLADFSPHFLHLLLLGLAGRTSLSNLLTPHRLEVDTCPWEEVGFIASSSPRGGFCLTSFSMDPTYFFLLTVGTVRYGFQLTFFYPDHSLLTSTQTTNLPP